jgi:nicotinate-nucleotide adenylyltransferase
MTRKIGIYPGTFDPVHSGHIAFSREAMRACGLEEVIFLPDPSPRGKAEATHILQRLALLEEALAHHEYVRALHIGEEMFTVQATLPELRRRFDGCELTLLIGSDVVRTFIYRWDGLDILLREMSLAIGMRVGDSPEEMKRIIRELENEHALTIRHKLVTTEYAAISSSRIRNS